MMIRGDDRPVSWTMSGTTRLEPITLPFAKLALKSGSTSEDALISAYIQAARSLFEEQTGRQCVDAVWEYALDGVPYYANASIELPRPPLSSVVAVTYDDGDGVEQIVDPDSYRVFPSILAEGSPAVAQAIDPYCPPGRIELISGASWPITNGQSRCLRIRRVCGYGSSVAAMPSLVQVTISLIVAHFFRQRQPVSDVQMYEVPMSVKALLEAFKWSALVTQRPRALDVDLPVNV